MTVRHVETRVHAMPVTEGAGVQIHRTIGLPALRNLDPFLMLDYFGTENPDDYIAGFPDHPHRGFITFTYMLDGHMRHRDSMGNEGDLQTGAAQWMKAASGVIHSEMPQQTGGRMSGFQLWINLPAAEKMASPEYQEFGADRFPLVSDGVATVKILAGRHGAQDGPIQDSITGLRYLDVDVPANGSFRCPSPAEETAFAYCFAGGGRIGERAFPHNELAVLTDGDEVEVHAGPDGVRFILVTGRPIGEPIVQHGPFVMNTREEIEQALADYRDGTLVQATGELARD